METPARVDFDFEYKGFRYATAGSDSGTRYGEIRGMIQILAYAGQEFSPSRFIRVPHTSRSLNDAAIAARGYAREIIDSGAIWNELPKRICAR